MALPKVVLTPEGCLWGSVQLAVRHAAGDPVAEKVVGGATLTGVVAEQQVAAAVSEIVSGWLSECTSVLLFVASKDHAAQVGGCAWKMCSAWKATHGRTRVCIRSFIRFILCRTRY